MLDTRSKPQPKGIWFRIMLSSNDDGIPVFSDWKYSALPDFWRNSIAYVEIWNGK